MAWRVLHLDTGTTWRGGQRQVLLLASGQRERGDEPLIVAPPDSPLLDRARTAGLAASTVRARGDWDLGAAARVSRIVRTWRPDIVHAHDARAHAIALASLVRRPTLPLVVSRRMAFVPRGRLKYGERVSRFLAISRAVADALRSGGVPGSRIDIVYDGVPLPHVAERRDWRTELGWPADTVICGLVGAMTAEKGVNLLGHIATAMPAAERQRARLVLLGGTASGHDVLGGIDTFRAGFVEDVHPAMAGLDVLWHPASTEGLGTVVIDAMALRVPPVTFAVGGLPELVVPGVTGLLVPPGDVTGFAAAASSLIRDAELRERLGAAGPARAAEFSVARMVEGTSHSYQAALDAARRARARRQHLGRSV